VIRDAPGLLNPRAGRGFEVNSHATIDRRATMSSVRRLTAILAADVAGYSRLMGADEEGTHERLKAHLRELVDPKIKEHRGRTVKNTGDGLLGSSYHTHLPAAIGVICIGALVGCSVSVACGWRCARLARCCVHG
jgi:class 3 adenylate cyclase